jgi:DNA ligase-1
MNFEIVANLFSELESTTKRLEKIKSLKEFYIKYENEVPLLFDVISGDYQRIINKKNIGISLKTIFSVLSFLSNKTQESIEKDFNKIGDVGKIGESLFQPNKQVVSNNSLELKDIITAFERIKNKTGKDSNKFKKEILSKLFMATNNPLEWKYLSRLLIDDLRIGVSVGTLKEAYLQGIFPPIYNLFSQEVLGKEVEYNYEKDSPTKILFLKNHTIKTENPRQLYNMLLELVEIKYNLLNSFQKIHSKLKENSKNLLVQEIELGNPIKTMQGIRAKNVDEAIDIVTENNLTDYKYDGLRVEIHNDKGKVNLFSRNLDNITKQFPEVIEFIKNNFSDLSFVMDAECVGYDYEKQKFLPFQLLSRRILTKDVGSVSHINVCVKTFDLLFLNGRTLISEPYSKRREMLEELFLNRDLKQKIHFDEKKLE